MIIQDATTRFYECIPHTSRRGQCLPMIGTAEAIKDKAELLDTM